MHRIRWHSEAYNATRIWNSLNTKVLTFLPLVEHRRAWMVHALLLGIGEGFPARFVDALLGHFVYVPDLGLSEGDKERWWLPNAA